MCFGGMVVWVYGSISRITYMVYVMSKAEKVDDGGIQRGASTQNKLERQSHGGISVNVQSMRKRSNKFKKTRRYNIQTNPVHRYHFQTHRTL